MSDVQNVKIRLVGEADLSQLDKEINKLSASELKVRQSLKAVDTQAKATHKTLQEESTKSTKAVDDSSKSFTALSDKVKNLSSQIPGAFQVQEILSFGKATQTAVSGVGAMSSAFNVLKAAIAATGIGLLVVALGSLVAYFKSTDEGAAKLDGIFRAIGATTKILTKYLLDAGEALLWAFEHPKEAIKELGEFIYNNIINRFKAILILADAVSTAFSGEFTKAAKLATDGIIQLNTGIANATDKMAAFGKEVGAAADEAYNLALAFDDLEDREREFSVTQAKMNKQINDLIIQSKNRTLTEQQRINLISQAGKMETDLLNQTLKLAKERLDLIYKENKLSRETGQLSDEQRQKEIDQINKITALETESLLLKEKLQNRSDVLKEESLNKELALLKRIAIEEENIQKERYANREISEEELQDNLAFIQLSGLKREREFLIQNGKDTTEINKTILDLMVKQRQDSDNKIVKGNKESSEEQRKQWKEDYEFYSALSEKNKKDEEKENKEAEEKKKKIIQGGFQLSASLSNDLFALEQRNLANELQDLQQKQAQELAMAGDSKEAQARVNEKYAKKELELKRKQAQVDKEQAAFNIILNTAKAVSSASPVVPLMAFAAATGAAELALVLSKPLPKYNKGTKSVPGYDTGKDSVYAMLRPGEGVMPVDRMKEYKPAFDAIFDRKIPADLINAIAMNPDILNAKVPVIETSNDKHFKILCDKLDKIKTLEINMDRKGIRSFLKGENSQTELENNYFRIK